MNWDIPEPIGKQKFTGQVWLCGRTDEAALLTDIVGTMYGSPNDHQYAQEIAALKAQGLITWRNHLFPDGTHVPAYRLTTRGFETLARIGYGNMHDSAVRQHRFYEARQSVSSEAEVG